ncbi:MAG: hypothetical protein NDI77_16220 [Geobacteraceae bacterium]|nr:hypothetical protein [Geobacteraceae bacterium]
MNVKACSGMCAFCRLNCRAEEGGMMVSAIEGRIRLRDERLKRHATALALESRLASCEAVLSASWNQRTGSMLIIYDAAATSEAAILAMLNAYVPVMRPTGKVSNITDAARKLPAGRPAVYRTPAVVAKAA